MPDLDDVWAFPEEAKDTYTTGKAMEQNRGQIRNKRLLEMPTDNKDHTRINKKCKIKCQDVDKHVDNAKDCIGNSSCIYCSNLDSFFEYFASFGYCIIS